MTSQLEAKPPAQRGGSARRRVAPYVPGAWIVLLFVSSFRFTGTRDVTLATQGVASPENMVELAAYAVIGALAGLRLLTRTPRFVPLGVALLGAFGLLAVASVLWSLIPLFTLVRAGQILVLAVFVAVSAGLWTEGQRSFIRDWRAIWVGYLAVVVIATIAGFVFPNYQSGRYAWPGMHTGTTAEYLAVAALVTLSMAIENGWGLGSRGRRLAAILFVASIVVLLLTITRSALFGFLAGAGVLVMSASRLGRERKILLVGGLVATSMAVFAWFSQGILEYVMRSQSTDQFFTFTGRTELWTFALSELQTSPLLGFGFGAARVVLIETFRWAGTGHNLWIEAALSTGLVGALILTALLLWMLARAVSLQRRVPGPAGNLGIGFVVMTLVTGFASTALALPGLAFSVAGLVLAGISVVPRPPSPDVALSPGLDGAQIET